MDEQLRPAGQNGNYGTLGVPSLSNLPEAREDMISWIDNYGNFWLFGGTGYYQ